MGKFYVEKKVILIFDRFFYLYLTAVGGKENYLDR